MHSLLIVPVTSGKEKVGCGNGGFKEHFPLPKVLEYLTVKMYVMSTCAISQVKNHLTIHRQKDEFRQCDTIYYLKWINYSYMYYHSLVPQLVKNPPAMRGDLGLIPGLRRAPGEWNSYPLQYSGLENSIDCIVHGVTKNRTWLSNFLMYHHR